MYSSRLETPEAGHEKPCIAGRLREAEGYRPYRLRYRYFVFLPNFLRKKHEQVFAKKRAVVANRTVGIS